LILVMELDNYDGFYYLENVKPQYPDIKILALTNKSDALTLNRISKYLARSCITKQTEVNEVKTAVLKIISGETYFPQNQMSNNDEIDSELFSNLTKRELMFVELSKTSLSYHDIATKMSVNYSTVNFHRANVFRKLKIKTRRELVDLINKNMNRKEVS
jgi:DNA-binding NarL/FixJ family response regulator